METDGKAVIQKPVTMEDLMQLLSQLNSNKPTTETTHQNIRPIQIPKKLNHKNFMKWAKLMQLELDGRGRLSHITASPPSQEDPEYTVVSTGLVGNLLDNWKH